MGDFYFYDGTGDQGLWSPSRPPAYGLQGGRVRNVISAETIGGRVRSESRGDDRLTLAMEWKYLTLAELRLLESIHATYGGNAAPFRLQVPNGVFPGVYGNAVVPVRWPSTDFSPSCVSSGLYSVRMLLVENIATSLVLSGTVTRANAHLSLIAGTAFADLIGVSLSTYAGSSYYLILTDTAGRRLAGYLKAAGGGETVDAELLVNGAFTTNTANWTEVNSTLAVIAGGESGNCLEITRVTGSLQQAYQSVAVTAGKLYKGSVYLKSGTSGAESGYVTLYSNGPSMSIDSSATSTGSWAQISAFACMASGGTAISVYLSKLSSTAGTMLFDTASLKQVLTPSATGATIVSTRGGTTYNWAYEDTGFNRNDAAGYHYAVYAY